ncbi:MAG TPA: indole-3-glycerol phosphate synthase TrpC [Thermomicrobiales bacterium]|nr:indole-3-glycerol phosphate synthase TrpC [Thermomicrobiales bacterium]
MSGHVATGTYLDRILARTTADLAERKRIVGADDLRRVAAARPDPVDFAAALARPVVGVIAEVKRGSPSRGLFPTAVDPADVAAAYVAGDAAAISVLTDGPFFQGSLEDLETVASVARAAEPAVPVLRKDFIVDAHQIVESRARGADALLLIVAALDDETLRALLRETRGWGMEALVEVHDAAEMARAVAAEARVIGINNRDLRDFAVDLATTERLAPLAPPGSVVVGESGIFERTDVERLQRAGVSAVLVGEGLIVQEDRAAAVRRLTIRPEATPAGDGGTP